MDDGTAMDIGPHAAYEIPPGHDAWVVGTEPWHSVEYTSARLFGLAPDQMGRTVLTTLLFTDIVGSTRTLEQVGDDRWRELVLAHNRAIREQLDAYLGREVDATGDGFLAMFDSATAAVRSGQSMTQAASTIGLHIRVGCHSGEVQVVGGKARGAAVHAAARVMALAGPDQLFVSSTTRDLLSGSGMRLEPEGFHELKGFDEPREIFRVV
jgi:class 3 adenylate cyclase